jgi:type IV pilus assembly protein PilF
MNRCPGVIISTWTHRSSVLLFLAITLVGSTFSGCSGGANLKKEKAVTMGDLGRTLSKNGAPREGLSYLLDASNLDPNNPEIQHDLACAYAEIEENDLALQHFKKAIALKPDFSEAINNMGILFSKMKDWDNAMACFRKVTANVLYQTPHFAYHNMGLIYYYKGDYPSAIENYLKAIKLAPGYVNVYYDLASSYEALNHYDEAVDALKKAVILTPKSRLADIALAKLYIKMARRQDATATLKKIIESDPKGEAAKEATQLLDNLK